MYDRQIVDKQSSMHSKYRGSLTTDSTRKDKVKTVEETIITDAVLKHILVNLFCLNEYYLVQLVIQNLNKTLPRSYLMH